MTAVLNLDTAVVFVTPIIVHAARQRDCDERPFLYGALFMANGASLLLPGSNLTNLIVLAHSRLSGAAFARDMALPWLAVVVLTIAFVAVVYRPKQRGRDGRAARAAAPRPRRGRDGGRDGAHPRPRTTPRCRCSRSGSSRLPCAGCGRMSLRRCCWASSRSPWLLGTLARLWHGPGLARRRSRRGGRGRPRCGRERRDQQPARGEPALGPAPPHPLPLLIGLNLGPNLAFTGSLSAYLWYRAARGAGAEPSLRLSSILGLALVPLTIAAALGALALVDAGAF